MSAEATHDGPDVVLENVDPALGPVFLDRAYYEKTPADQIGWGKISGS